MTDQIDIRIDYSNMLDGNIKNKHGISGIEMEKRFPLAVASLKSFNDARKNGDIGFFDLPGSDTRDIVRYASHVRERFENLVVLGIGGSALGTSAVNSALNHSWRNLLPKRKRNGYPRLFVADNIDPDWFEETLSIVDPKKTLYNIISKSGSTAETMSQFMVVLDRLKTSLKGKWKKKVVITTDPDKGVLREIVREFGLDSFPVPPNVGGRFSVFSAVGLLPLACVGIDIGSFLAGASRMAARCLIERPVENPALMFALLNYIADVEKGKKMTVMLPYSTKLYGIADWFRQLWAESLGKKSDLQGNTVHTGQTPIKALGVTDQHSQVQLYVEGPNDKVVVFIEIEKFATDVGIPALFGEKGSLSYLGGNSLNSLIKTEMEGTAYALTSHDRPNMTIRLPKLNAHTLGQLMFMLSAATAFAGGLYGINPYDQPGVEFGKDYTYAMMGHAGYEKLKKEVESRRGSSKNVTV